MTIQAGSGSVWLNSCLATFTSEKENGKSYDVCATLSTEGLLSLAHTTGYCAGVTHS